MHGPMNVKNMYFLFRPFDRDVEFEVLTAVLKKLVFWDMLPCSLID